MKYLIILLLFLPTAIKSAELIDKKYPYYIFNDDGVIRWCEDPTEYGYSKTTCWTRGIPTKCKVVRPEEGFIDCKLEDK